MADELNTITGAEETPTATEQTTYTAEEVQDLIQREADKRVSEALKKADKKKMAAIKEAERLAALSEEERNAEKIKQLELDLAEREKQINVRENKIACIAEMEKRNIPTVLVDFIVTDDADVMLENLTTFEKTLKKLVNDEVSKRLSSTAPKAGAVDTMELTKDTFKKLSLAEQNALYLKDKDLYLKLIN